jgi:hypothetical protein
MSNQLDWRPAADCHKWKCSCKVLAYKPDLRRWYPAANQWYHDNCMAGQGEHCRRWQCSCDVLQHMPKYQWCSVAYAFWKTRCMAQKPYPAMKPVSLPSFSNGYRYY